MTTLLTLEERIEYDRLAVDASSTSLSEVALKLEARRIVAERRVQRKIQTLRDLAAQSLGWKQKLAVYVLWTWAKENGMEFIGNIIGNVFAQKGWQTSLLGAAMLTMAGFVTFYCATDATGGWIDPHCAYYVKAALWLTGVGHFLAPGFTATLAKKDA